MFDLGQTFAACYLTAILLPLVGLGVLRLFVGPDQFKASKAELLPLAAFALLLGWPVGFAATGLVALAT